ncbi:uncharacterized protein C8R40DRAFT_1126173 [Lentinula edodes]|uniref:uncharacterized protein n=1 Tax=Lentinula edodes TaxID=5353 RepID=UPI001E8E8683|nr:uncharacterized protein C8R40DRAFT_1126173 [Lentinula edodes]KAH7870528.1 hypothetical protein C8R40DRAFT_1126173 [Lentinula edodes]
MPFSARFLILNLLSSHFSILLSLCVFDTRLLPCTIKLSTPFHTPSEPRISRTSPTSTFQLIHSCQLSQIALGPIVNTATTRKVCFER